jgi:phage shock protein E
MEDVMRKWMIMSLMSVTVLVLGACQGSGVESVNADQALELLANDPSIVLLDVREYSEHIEKRIEGSQLLSLSVIEVLLENQFPNKETTFIVYCRSGRRSAEAIQIMLEKGYQNIYDLGGLNDWPYETISGRPS